MQSRVCLGWKARFGSKTPQATVRLRFCLKSRHLFRIMKSRHLLPAGLAALLLSSCLQTPKSKTLDVQMQKAIESDLLHTRSFLRTLNALDAGDATKARKIAIIPVLMDLDFAQYYFTKGLSSPTREQTEQWTKAASETLDYMLKHRDEWDPRRVDVQGGMRGLRYFLTKPEDIRRLDELSGQLVENEKKALGIQKP